MWWRRDAVEHGVDRHLRGALDAGEHLLLLDRDAELLVTRRISGSTSSRLPSFFPFALARLIISVLKIDLGDVELGPAHSFMVSQAR